MHPSIPIVILLSSLAAAVPTGCVDTKQELEPRPDTRPMVGDIRQAEENWAWISAQRWRLDTIDAHPPIEDSELDLSFKEHTWLTGSSGCNRFTASYTRRSDDGLQVSQILSTRMYCAHPQGVMQQEARYLHLLQSVDAYHAEPDRLDLYADDKIVLSFTPAED